VVLEAEAKAKAGEREYLASRLGVASSELLLSEKLQCLGAEFTLQRKQLDHQELKDRQAEQTMSSAEAAFIPRAARAWAGCGEQREMMQQVSQEMIEMSNDLVQETRLLRQAGHKLGQQDGVHSGGEWICRLAYCGNIFNLKRALDLLSLAFAVWRWPALLLLPPGAALGAPGGQGWVGPGLPGAARAPCPLPPRSSCGDADEIRPRLMSTEK
jgi:hypothetical protein